VCVILLVLSKAPSGQLVVKLPAAAEEGTTSFQPHQPHKMGTAWCAFISSTHTESAYCSHSQTAHSVKAHPPPPPPFQPC